MTENPYDSALIPWVEIDQSREDHIYEGMTVLVEDAWEGTVIGVKSYDVDQDSDGGYRVYPTEVQVEWTDEETDEVESDWYSLSFVAFKSYELERGQARYEARSLIRKYKVDCRPTKVGYRYYGGWHGRPVVTSADFAPIDSASREDIPF